MPLYKTISINQSTTAYIWHITEDVTWLYRAVSLSESSVLRLNGMRSVAHQKGFLAVRMLLQHLGYTDHDLIYDPSGKPYLTLEVGNLRSEDFQITNHQLAIHKHISISHSHEFSSICISDEVVGIDMELMKAKVLKIAPRFLDINHLANLSETQQIQKATVIWGIKESLFKIKSERGISFPDHIFEGEFELQDAKCTAELRFNHQIELFNIQFYTVHDYVFVCALKKI